MQTDQEKRPPVGIAQDLGSDLRRILAPNPSPMTFWGTNTYVLGTRQLAVIDPGPDDTAHLQAILRAIGPGQCVSHILVTHAHLDHSPLAARLSDETGAPVFAYGDARAGRSPVMQHLADTGMIGGGEGVDVTFTPDQLLFDGESVVGDGWQITPHWTPGHFGNHLCFVIEDTILTGDLVMGWASSLVSPPDGDLTQFMASCRRLKALHARRFLPGHGGPIEDPAARLDWLISHRLAREAAILEVLHAGPRSASQVTAIVYADTPAHLLPVARRNVLAHLIDLTQKSRIIPLGELHADTAFACL
ncbi:MBL fold metallo-hydrolase [Roseovarius sp. 217]|uniref:MBL fold metallo-hydrolase n=1 Tax=Roseovarius sp. (strain 217) TaxID=314264 RepID=UPI0000685B4D|nr:MBL fold metallo-hydrolase [Roseovarius sp. 217]EAQ27090.1 metallo-beta-lactamase family protein [Roseovarius sp. 217]